MESGGPVAATVLSVTRPRPRSESSVKLTVVLSTAPTFMPATTSQWRVMPSGSRGSPGAAKSTANADPVTVGASTLSTGSPPSTSPLSFASRTSLSQFVRIGDFFHYDR